MDGDGAVTPLTNGLLLVRHLFTFTGGALVDGAVSAGCTRCGAATIASYLAGLAA